MSDSADIEKALQTDATRAICKEVARRSRGVCLLAFSRGRDSIAAWLQLRRHFDRIIPFHCASVPHLGFVDRSLAHYEQFFGTPIERLLNGAAMRAVQGMLYQEPGDQEAAGKLFAHEWTTDDLIVYMRNRYKVPQAWCAYGIRAGETIGRQVNATRKHGMDEEKRTFQPVFDWSMHLVLLNIKHAGVKLPGDYTFTDRSFHTPDTWILLLQALAEKYPEDMRRIEELFPLARAAIARNEFRRMKAKRAEAAAKSAEVEQAPLDQIALSELL